MRRGIAPKMRTIVTEIRMAPTGLVSWSRNRGSVWRRQAPARASSQHLQRSDKQASARTHLHGGRIHQQQRHQQLVAFVHELQAAHDRASVRRTEVRAHSAGNHRAARTGATAAACFFCVSVPLRLSTWARRGETQSLW